MKTHGLDELLPSLLNVNRGKAAWRIVGEAGCGIELTLDVTRR